MKLAVMQPYIFPYLGYYQLAHSSDKFVFYDDVNFINRGWINRNNIVINNRSSLFTIPLKNASQNEIINKVFISEEFPWRIKLFKTLEMSYRKAPFYEPAMEIISETLNSKSNQISEIAKKSVIDVFDYLGLNKDFKATSADYLNESLKGQERILDICKKESASQYINAIGGRSLYDPLKFLEEGIHLSFLESVLDEYSQFSSEFIKGMSIIDVLMHNSPDQIKKMLANYNLI